MTTQPITPVASQQFERSIKYCKVTKDYEIRVNDSVIGYAASYVDAERVADEYVYEALNRTAEAA